LLTTTVMAVCLSLAVFLGFAVWDAASRLSQAWLGLMFVVWLAATIAVATIVIRRLLYSQRSMEATARRVEAEFPEVGSNLINLVQFAEDEQTQQGRAFRVTAMDRAAVGVEHVDFHRAAGRLSRWSRFSNCMQTTRDLAEWFVVFALLVALTLFCAGWFPSLGSAAMRLLTPWRFTPSVGVVEIIEVAPGDAEVLRGTGLTVTAEIENPGAKAYRGVLFITRDGQAEVELPMTTDQQRRHYSFTVPVVDGPLSYRLEIGDSQSDMYYVTVREKPAIERVEVTFQFPSYMGRDDRTLMQEHADLVAPRGTVARLRVNPRLPVRSGYCRINDRQVDGRLGDDGAIELSVPMIEDGTFTIHLVDEGGYSDPRPRVNRIEVLPDEPPRVQFLKPSGKTTVAAPGDVVPLAVRAVDDHGLSRVLLEAKVAEPARAGDAESETTPEKAPTTIDEWTDLENASAAVRESDLELLADAFRPGQVVMVRAVAWDNRSLSGDGPESMPQRTASDWVAVKIVQPRTKATADRARLSELREALAKILEMQLEARAATGRVVGEAWEADREKCEAKFAPIRKRQLLIRAIAKRIVDNLERDDSAAGAKLKPVLANLVSGQMIAAVVWCDKLPKMTDPAEISDGSDAFLTVQDEIIQSLRWLVEAAPTDPEGSDDAAEEEAGEELSEDQRRELEELGEKLEELQREQEEVVEKTKELAETPSDELTEEQKQQLDDLADTEEKLSQSIEQAGEKSVEDKAAEVREELKKAEDALREGDAEEALAAEEAAAEKAEQLKNEIDERLSEDSAEEGEPWEETLGDETAEEIAADGQPEEVDESPGRLEQAIDSLIEDEGQFFNELEDAAAAGISEQSMIETGQSDLMTKGSTDGAATDRYSKSNGTDEDGAAGTPGDETGEDGDSGGGAGGKVKKYGDEEGEGGAMGDPADVPEMERLADKQTELRSKAASLRSQLDLEDFHPGDLMKMMGLMEQVERDLRAGRYQEALQKRDLLSGGLGSLKRYIRGEFKVRRDRSGNLPGEIQKEIRSSAADPSPDGWDELNQRYFKRLAE